MKPNYNLELDYLIKKLCEIKKLRGAQADFIREFNKKTKKTNSQGFIDKIIKGKITFQKSLQLEIAIEAVEKVLSKHLKGKIQFNDKVDWIFLKKDQLEKFILQEIYNYTSCYNNFFKYQEKISLQNFREKYYVYNSNFGSGIDKKFKNFLSYSFLSPQKFHSFKSQITPAIIQLLNTLSIAFPAGHTATASVLFYLKRYYDIHWTIDYTTTHSIYLKNSIKTQKIVPDILVIADSLALDLFHHSYGFRTFFPFMFLWKNDMVILGSTSKSEKQ